MPSWASLTHMRLAERYHRSLLSHSHRQSASPHHTSLRCRHSQQWCVQYQRQQSASPHRTSLRCRHSQQWCVQYQRQQSASPHRTSLRCRHSQQLPMLSLCHHMSEFVQQTQLVQRQ